MELSLSNDAAVQLTELAKQLGYFRGMEGNRSALVEAIALGDLLVSHPWSQDTIAAFMQSFRLLGDLGQSDYRNELGRFLLESGQLPPIFQSEIEMATKRQAWSDVVRHHILQKQPFKLHYKDAADRPFLFTIHYAEMTFHEKRSYLDIWAAETEDNQDLPALQHNCDSIALLMLVSFPLQGNGGMRD